MKHRSTFVGAVSALAAFTPGVVLAQGFIDKVGGGVNSAAAPAGFQPGGPTLPVIIGNVIGALLSLVGVILLVLLIYAGFLYMTAGGNTEQVKKAQQMIRNSIVGIIIIAASYALSSFVLQSISGATTGGGGQ